MRYIRIFYFNIVLLLTESVVTIQASNFTVDALNIAKINLSHERLKIEDIEKLFNNLKTNTTLTELHLRSNNIGDKGGQALGEALKTNTTLTRLDLESNNIGAEGGQALGEALKANTTLTELDLRSNNIGDKGGQALGEALKANTTLTELHLGSNNIGAEGGQALGEALKTNTTLTDLNLNYNNIGAEGGLIGILIAKNRQFQPLTRQLAQQKQISQQTQQEIDVSNKRSLNLKQQLIHEQQIFQQVQQDKEKQLSTQFLNLNTEQQLINQRTQFNTSLMLDLLMPLAKQGHAPSQGVLALAYLQGNGVDQDIDLSLHWLSKAYRTDANKDINDINDVSDVNGNTVLDPFKKLALAGDAQPNPNSVIAQYILGQIYTNHPGGAQQAIDWHGRAALQGYKPSQDQLQKLLSKELIDLAHQGDTQAQYNLYQQLANAPYETLYQQQALDWLYKSAHSKNNDALKLLSGFYKDGDHGVAQNINQAIKMYHQLLQLDDGQQAYTHLQNLAQEGHVNAQYALGQAYEKGQWVNRKLHLAIEHYKQAAAQDHVPSIYALGQLYEQGAESHIRNIKDIIKAYLTAQGFYQTAWDHGFIQAGSGLTRIQQQLTYFDHIDHVAAHPKLTNVLIKEVKEVVSYNALSLSLLYDAAIVTEGILLNSNNEPARLAVLKAIKMLSDLPAHSIVTQAFSHYMADLVIKDEPIHKLLTVCHTICSLQESDLGIIPSALPQKLRPTMSGMYDSRITLFNSLFQTFLSPELDFNLDPTLTRLASLFTKLSQNSQKPQSNLENSLESSSESNPKDSSEGNVDHQLQQPLLSTISKTVTDSSAKPIDLNLINSKNSSKNRNSNSNRNNDDQISNVENAATLKTALHQSLLKDNKLDVILADYLMRNETTLYQLDTLKQQEYLQVWAQQAVLSTQHHSDELKETMRQFYNTYALNSLVQDHQNISLVSRIALTLADLRKGYVEEARLNLKQFEDKEINTQAQEIGVKVSAEKQFYYQVSRQFHLLSDSNIELFDELNTLDNTPHHRSHYQAQVDNITKPVMLKWTVDNLIHHIMNEANNSHHTSAKMQLNDIENLLKAQGYTPAVLKEFFEDNKLTNTGAKALLFNTGYIEEDLDDKKK